MRVPAVLGSSAMADGRMAAAAMRHAGIHADKIEPTQRDHRSETAKSEETVAPSPRVDLHIGPRHDAHAER